MTYSSPTYGPDRRDPTADHLLRHVRALAQREPLVCDLLDIDLAAQGDDVDLLAAVLASVIPGDRPRTTLNQIARSAFRLDPSIVTAAYADIEAAVERNLEPGGVPTVLLFYRGFHALLAYRVAHHFWGAEAFDKALAIKTALDRPLSTDIHPAAQIGAGVWLDHGVGVVIGETAIIEDDVSIWHGVTLGSTLKDSGPNRHPRIRRGATIGASAILLGDIEIGIGSVVAAGSVVLQDVPPHTTVAGVPARARKRSDESFQGFASASGDLP